MIVLYVCNYLYCTVTTRLLAIQPALSEHGSTYIAAVVTEVPPAECVPYRLLLSPLICALPEDKHCEPSLELYCMKVESA